MDTNRSTLPVASSVVSVSWTKLAELERKNEKKANEPALRDETMGTEGVRGCWGAVAVLVIAKLYEDNGRVVNTIAFHRHCVVHDIQGFSGPITAL